MSGGNRSRPARSKAVAAWLAVVGGALGAQRFYLHGLRDGWGWACWLPTAAGLAGVVRMRLLGQDDRIAWALVPLLGLTISGAMLAGIVHALTPDAAWNARHNPGMVGWRASGWGAVAAAITGLMIGAAVLMGTIAFGVQMLFEWQAQAPLAATAARG